MRRFSTPFLLILAMSFMANFSVAQDQTAVEPVTLDEKFIDLNATSETYEQYKVIPSARLNDFWKEVLDTLNTRKTSVEQLEVLSADRKLEAEQLQSQIDGINAELEKAQSNTTTISFLGAEIQKSTYHLLVWGIIFVLIIVCVVIWWTSKSGATSAKQAREAYETLNTELESAKNKARESQVKLKRELQTALNQIEELKRGRNS